LPSPRVEPLPLTVGVHYSEAFQREKHEDKHVPYWMVHEPGGASVALFERVLAATFERVVRIPTWPSAGGARPEVALVIVPSISGVNTDFPTYSTRTIFYEISIFTAGGVRIDTWNVNATGRGTLFTSDETFSASALRDAATQLLIGLRERSEIRARLPAHDPEPFTEVADGWARNRGIVILPNAPDDESWVTCMKDALSRGSVPLVEVDRFRDAVFPWFEPSVNQPTTPEAWVQRLKDPLVAAGAMEAGARYVMFVDGSTSHSEQEGPFMCGGGAVGAACLGVTSAERHSSLNLAVGDFMRGEMAGEIEASETGSFTWVGLILPIPIIDMTETEACHKAAADVRALLKRRQLLDLVLSPDDKADAIPKADVISLQPPDEDYLNCVKRGDRKCDDVVSCFSGGKRQWTNRSKCD